MNRSPQRKKEKRRRIPKVVRGVVKPARVTRQQIYDKRDAWLLRAAAGQVQDDSPTWDYETIKEADLKTVRPVPFMQHIQAVQFAAEHGYQERKEESARPLRDSSRKRADDAVGNRTRMRVAIRRLWARHPEARRWQTKRILRALEKQPAAYFDSGQLPYPRPSTRMRVIKEALAELRQTDKS